MPIRTRNLPVMYKTETQPASALRALPWPRLSAALSALARPRIRLFGRSWPAFQVCGYTGVLAAIGLTMTLVARTGLSYRMMGAIVVSAMLTFLALVAGTKIITGEEQIIYYHHEIGVMLV